MPFLISVVMPCYNSEQYLSYAIESILKQSFTMFELIIINDGSTDNSDAVIRKYVTDLRIRYVGYKKNKGNYVARNIGLRLARGKYICVMDADDISYPNRLKNQLRYMQKHPTIGLAGSWGHCIDCEGTINGTFKKPLSYNDIKLGLLIENKYIHSSIIIRRRLQKKYHIYYNEKLFYSADYDFIVRCSQKFKITNTADILVQYRIHENQISSCKRKLQVQFANHVKLKQLHAFRMAPTKDDLCLHLALVNRQILSDTDIKHALVWLNKLLESNKKLQLYNQTGLYNCFAFILQIAIANKKNHAASL